jgi:hypothetical protein
MLMPRLPLRNEFLLISIMQNDSKTNSVRPYTGIKACHESTYEFCDLARLVRAEAEVNNEVPRREESLCEIPTHEAARTPRIFMRKPCDRMLNCRDIILEQMHERSMKNSRLKHSCVLLYAHRKAAENSREAGACSIVP